jgi:mannose-1-phosphate guanylyltransferase/mannose-6-phosphate isomerase
VPISFYPVILSGGSGSRLWPMSRKLLPKQFLPLVSERTLFQDTVLRLRGVEGAGAPIVVSNDEHRFLVAEQMREIGMKSEVQILEPVGRNTAPAVAVVALHIQDRHPDACMLVLPSDHLIRNVPAFHAAIATALPLAAGGSLITFGITPRGPVTGYGYIERGDPVRGSERSFRVQRYV